MTKVIIVGQAKSGTTALFHKISNAMPGATKRYFEPKPETLKKIARVWSPRPVLVKYLCGPKRPVPDLSRFDKRIFVLRDPRDQVISGLFYRTHGLSRVDHPKSLLDPENYESLIGRLRQKEQAPREHSIFATFPSLDSVCRDRMRAHQVVSKGLAGNDFLRFKYEDMVAGHLDELEQYLGVPLEIETEVDQKHERVARSKTSGSWRHFLLPSELPQLREALGPYLWQHGYADNWELACPQVVRPEVCSQYVAKVVQLRLRDLRLELQRRQSPISVGGEAVVRFAHEACQQLKSKFAGLRTRRTKMEQLTTR